MVPAAPFGVDDVVDTPDAEAEDRAQARARAASVAKTWESLLDDTGCIRRHDDRAFLRERAAAQTIERPSATAESAGEVVRRAMVRFTQLLVDMTDAARQTDYKPRRLEFAVEAANRFTRKFLAENPLAELGLAVLRGGTCEVAAPLSSSSEELEERLLAAASGGPRGRMSIVSGLLRAISSLEEAPPYGTREVLVLFGSLSNWDPVEMSVEGVLANMLERRIRVSVVSMSPELHVLQRICTQTGGSYGVALDSGHFEELLLGHVPAPVCGPRAVAPKLIRMGFPRQVFEVAGPAACSCHLKLHSRLFMCPQCHARVCKVPSRCKSCELPLASAPLVARAFRHLKPLPPFSEAAVGGDSICCGCQSTGVHTRQCPKCGNRFCEVCDAFTHDALQQCPGCLEGARLEK